MTAIPYSASAPTGGVLQDPSPLPARMTETAVPTGFVQGYPPVPARLTESSPPVVPRDVTDDFGGQPKRIICPHCHQGVLTEITYRPLREDMDLCSRIIMFVICCPVAVWVRLMIALFCEQILFFSLTHNLLQLVI